MSSHLDMVMARERALAAVGLHLPPEDVLRCIGIYKATVRDRFGRIIAEHYAPNLVTTVGKNKILDEALAGSAYTATWYMGLISSVSYSTIVATDTMASHAGWLEAGIANAPTYSDATRRTTAWSAASAGSKALSAGLVFNISGTGTIKGFFINSVSTKDGTTGVLLSAGLFSGGDQPVVNTNTVTVTYTMSLT